MSLRTMWRDGDRERSVEIVPLGGGLFRVSVDGADFELRAEHLGAGALRLETEQGPVTAEVTAVGNRRFVRLGRLDFVIEKESAGRRRSSAGHHGGLESPMPGVITRVMVEPGDDVQKGQPLVAVEAMKMEHLIRAPHAGRVKSIRAQAGEMVEGGVALVELEESEP
jgi:biotin carboxyl carrier protein